jgi:hypothetical protein
MKCAAGFVAVALMAGCHPDPGGDLDAGMQTAKGAPVGFTFEAVEARSFASFGYSGIIHNIRTPEGTAFGVKVLSCDRPDGICQFDGPVDPVSAVSRRRCLNKMGQTCNIDDDCPTDGTRFKRCAYIYDVPTALPQVGLPPVAGQPGLIGACGFSYIPLSKPGEPSSIVGTMDMTSGELNLQNLTVNLIQNGAALSTTAGTFRGTCMECVGDRIANDGLKEGTCTVVPHTGQAVDPSPDVGQKCDVNRYGTLPDFSGSYSMDCSPSVKNTDTEINQFGGTFTSSGFQVAITDQSPMCSDPEFTNERCFCAMCPDNFTACRSNADCGGAQCGYLPPLCDPNPAPVTVDGMPNPNFVPTVAPEACKNGAVGAATRPNACVKPGCIWNADTGLGTCISTLTGKQVGCYPSGATAKVIAPGKISKIGSVFVVDTGNARCTKIQSAGANALLGLPGLTFQKRSFRIIPRYQQ